MNNIHNTNRALIRRSRKTIENCDWDNLPERVVHDHLLSLVKKYKAPVGIRVSQLPFNAQPPVLSLPFYAVERIGQLANRFPG
ncbi:MAG: hypothetical protein GY765_38085 [bacterium]|nr:hypothetical protein [bacterium]